MRKAIIAAIVATALFAVGAFAASFAVDSEDIASGAGAVERCASQVLIQFGDLTPPTGGETDWTVSDATATFHNGDPDNPVSTCDDFTSSLALITGTSAFSDIDPEVVGADGVLGTGKVNFTFDAQDVGPITGASVAVEGQQLEASFVQPDLP